VSWTGVWDCVVESPTVPLCPLAANLAWGVGEQEEEQAPGPFG
jgi:hypothetical protein